MSRRNPVVPSQVKTALGLRPEDDDDEILRWFKRRTSAICKPCWELKYCPYGPLVEDSPLLPPVRSDAVRHNDYLRNCLESGSFGEGESERPLDDERRGFFEKSVAAFDPEAYPESIPQLIADAACRVFGHLCPVTYHGEGVSETTEVRAIGRRSVPFKVKARVSRRDNYSCQVCGTHLNEEAMEFDHIIPVSKGGSNEEHNVRLTCIECNRRKSNRVDNTLDLIGL